MLTQMRAFSVVTVSVGLCLDNGGEHCPNFKIFETLIISKWAVLDLNQWHPACKARGVNKHEEI